MGRAQRLEFVIDWIDSVDGIEVKTLAYFNLAIDGLPVWPVRGESSDSLDGFELYADELLAHLTECWKPLILRQNYPIPVQPARPSHLLVTAEERWADRDILRQNEEPQVAAFEDVHNLASAFGGISGLPPLWFFRDRDRMVVDTADDYFRIPFSQAREALATIGDKIAARLLEASAEKWAKLLDAWKRKDEGDETLLLALTIGRDRSTAAALVSEELLETPKSFEEAANDRDEFRIAARMAGPLPLDQIATILQKLRECEGRSVPKLRDASAHALEFIRGDDLLEAAPHKQGQDLAIWLRRFLNLFPTQGIDPITILERGLNVDVRAIDFGIPALDAIAVWGPKHGPASLLNLNSKRFRNDKNFYKSGAVRVTLAHELCHLLVDSEHTLSAVEVLGGRMPLAIEQRAKAFAAEFLLPSEEAGQIWRGEGYPLDPEGLERVVKRICKKFSVTASVAAWQLQHGAPSGYWEELDRALDQIVPQR